MPSDEEAVAKINQIDELDREGRFSEALEGFLWLHKHVFMKPKGPTEMSWVFAVRSWIELAAKHPPATAALLAVREEVYNLLVTDPKGFKHLDYLATLDFSRKDYSAAKSVYQTIKANGLDTSLYEFSHKDICESGDKDWITDFLVQPEETIKKACFRYQSTWYSLQSSSVLKDSEVPDDFYLNHIVEHMATLLRMSAIAYGSDKGKELERQALSWIDSPIIKQALIKELADSQG